MNKSDMPEYRVWRDIRQRCLNPKCRAYPTYGGRGIKICSRWDSFDAFLSDMGPRQHGQSIDRINVDGDYEPDNCRWADAFTQGRNKQSHKRQDVGVRFNTRDNCWEAFIRAGGKNVRIGGHATKDQAIAARKDAEHRYWKLGEQPRQAGELQRNNTSGHVGVSRVTRGKWVAWEAYTYRQRKKIIFGRFPTIEQAVAARHHGITGEPTPLQKLADLSKEIWEGL